MTKYKERDIVLVGFEFSEGAGLKKMPALIISNDGYHTSRREVKENIRKTIVLTNRNEINKVSLRATAKQSPFTTYRDNVSGLPRRKHHSSQ